MATLPAEEVDANICTHDAPRATTFSKACDIVRYIISTCITLGCVGIVCYGIAKGYATLPGPPAALFVVLVLVLVLLAYLEGLQVAILALERIPAESFEHSHPRAYRVHKLATRGEGLNVQRFLVGRQFFVVFVVFVCAQLTTYPTLPRDIVPEWLMVAVIDTGLPGALIVLAFGQLMPQLIAATHPRSFLNLFGTRQVVLLTLWVESLGITHFSWLLVRVVKWCFSMKDAAHDADDNMSMSSMEEGIQPGSTSALTSKLNPLLLPHEEYEAWQDAKTSLDLDASDPSLQTLIHEGATLGVEASSAADVGSKKTMAWLRAHSLRLPLNLGLGGKDARMMCDMGSVHARAARTSVSSTSPADPFAFYPSPAQLVQYLMDANCPVPRYLLPPNHHKHIPPHIVAFDMISRHDRVVERTQRAPGCNAY